MNINVYDVRTLIGLLVWGNLTCVVLISSYMLSIKDAGDKELGKSVMTAKLLFALGFIFISHRDSLPDILSINAGNTFLILAAYFEGRSILMTFVGKGGALYKQLIALTILIVLLLNISIYMQPTSLLRIAVGSFGSYIIIIIPTLKLFFSKDSSRFKRIVGVFYFIISALLLPRGIYFFLHPESLTFTSSPIQGLTYTAFLILTIFSLSTFLLLMKEEADKKLQALAHTDFLTGLNNRQSFFDSVAGPFERHRREKVPCSVLFMDIDHFKKVNDTYGHAFGDEVLKTASAILKAMVRGYDIPCRFGGEEFAAFIDNATAEAGEITAERIRMHMKEARFTEQPGFTFSVSIGVATGIPGENDDINTFIGIADEALYEAKEAGRDRVIHRTHPAAEQLKTA